MERYTNRGGDSGIRAFEAGDDYLIVEFRGGSTYLYTWQYTGREHIENMKKLAAGGKGLGTYISKHVGMNYEKKLK